MSDKKWFLNTDVIEGTDICEEGIPHTNRSIVTNLNRYESNLNELKTKNQRLEQDRENLFKFKAELREAIKNERTDRGRNVLKQLADNLGVDYD